ncbi:MAG: winged helix-turn-helix transcriptional regulator [Bdellovibrionaceae bacterium]|nr:winged helix-turn-helix transcriptional regulator [Pseudobdellovibrionaceae bacterium]
MLVELFGSQTTVKCLLYLEALREGYPSEISKAFGISNTQVNRTLEKLEQADILVAQPKGRARVYSFNKRWLLFPELDALLAKVVRNMPIEDREKYFATRKRPRKKNKTL